MKYAIMLLGLFCLSGPVYAADAVQINDSRYKGCSTKFFEDNFNAPFNKVPHANTWDVTHAVEYPVMQATDECRSGTCITRDIKKGFYGSYQIRYHAMPQGNPQPAYFTSHWIKFKPGFVPSYAVGTSQFKYVYNRASNPTPPIPGIIGQVCYYSGQSGLKNDPVTKKPYDPIQAHTYLHVGCDFTGLALGHYDISSIYSDGLWHRLEERVQANVSYEMWYDGNYIGKVDLANGDGGKVARGFSDTMIGPYFNGQPQSDGKFWLDDFQICLENRCP